MMGVNARCLLVRRGNLCISYSSMETAGREVYVQSRAMGQPSVTDGLSPSVLSYLRVSISLNWTDFLGLCRLLSDAIVFDSLLISLLISILALDEELEKLSVSESESESVSWCNACFISPY